MFFSVISTFGQSQVYDTFLQLNFEQTRSLLATRSPNAQILYLDNLNDCAQLILNEDPEQFDLFDERYEERLKLLEEIPDGAEKGFLASEIRLQWAFISGKYGNSWNAFWTLRKALILIQKNIEAYPEFALNDRTIGLLNVVLDLVPDNRKWLLNFFGMKGDFELGYEQMSKTVKGQDRWSIESQLMLALINSYVLENETDLSYLPNVPLYNYAKGLVANKQHQAGEAVLYFESLDKQIALKPYLLGESYFNMSQYDLSIAYYQLFLKNPKFKNYRKDAAMKIGLSYWFVDANLNRASEYFELARSFSTTESEIDKNANRLLTGIEENNPDLLRLRYSLDGGDYLKSKNLIDLLEGQELSITQQLEFSYRQARYYQLISENERAILLYNQVIFSYQETANVYFVPNAYLQLGKIYQALNQVEESMSYYQKVLTFEDHTYKQSIDLKAKIALTQLDRSND